MSMNSAHCAECDDIYIQGVGLWEVPRSQNPTSYRHKLTKIEWKSKFMWYGDIIYINICIVLEETNRTIPYLTQFRPLRVVTFFGPWWPSCTPQTKMDYIFGFYASNSISLRQNYVDSFMGHFWVLSFILTIYLLNLKILKSLGFGLKFSEF